MTTTIAIACHAGGVGKTTTTLHLAGLLTQVHDGNVLTIDLDPQASLTRSSQPWWLDQEEQGITTSELLTNRMPLRTSPVEVVTSARDDGEWMIVPTSVQLQETAAWLQMQPITHDHLRTALDGAGHWDFDAILFDCPPAADLLTINAICAADYVIVPVIPEEKGLDGLLRMVQLVDWLNTKRVSQAQILGMVITQVDSRTKAHQQGVIDLRATGVPVLAEIPMAKGQDQDARLRHAYAPLVTDVIAVL